MKQKLKKILLQTKDKLPALALTLAAFLIFGLYYLGVYDISFIPRPAAWQNNADLLYAALAPAPDAPDAPENVPENNTPETSAPEEDERPSRPQSDKTDTGETDTSINRYTVLDASSTLAELGYYRTDKVFDATCKFALLSLPYELPEYYTYSEKTYDKTVAVTYDDGKEAETKVETVTEGRLGIELYMGYIILNDLGTVYLVGPDGTLLTQYDDSRYIPAYTRDKEGRPLFYSKYKYQVNYPVEVGEEDADGNKPWITHETLNLEGKKYYYLNDHGKFIESDYNDATDNRGLYFDYPAYYGVPDKNDTKDMLLRYYRETTKVTSIFDSYGKKTTTVLPSIEWLFKKKDLPNFDPDAEETVYPYTAAYNYSEGYATVRMNTEWIHYDYDDPTITTTYKTNELFVVNEKGEPMFASRKGFSSDMNWIANEFYCDPLIRDISAIGSYYFDHGLMRIRRQYYDRYIFTEYDQVLIGADEDLLIRPNGEEFYIPSGYDLISYSNGILTLEKDGKYGLMDYTGKWVVQPTLDGAGPFVEGVAAIKQRGLWGMVDTTGNLVIPPRYSYISNISSSLVAAYNENSGWEIYVKMCA